MWISPKGQSPCNRIVAKQDHQQSPKNVLCTSENHFMRASLRIATSKQLSDAVQYTGSQLIVSKEQKTEWNTWNNHKNEQCPQTCMCMDTAQCANLCANAHTYVQRCYPSLKKSASLRRDEFKSNGSSSLTISGHFIRAVYCLSASYERNWESKYDNCLKDMLAPEEVDEEDLGDSSIDHAVSTAIAHFAPAM